MTTCVDDPNQNGGVGGTTPAPPPTFNPCDGEPPLISSKKSLGNKVMRVPLTECDSVVVDCAGVSGGSAHDSPCGCIGGTTGIPECPDIKDELEKYPCAKGLVAQFSTLKGDIAALIKNTFGKNDNINIVFKPDSGLIGTSTDGVTHGTASGAGSIGNFELGLNPDVLNKASKEYILVTMYHEALHAYLNLKWAQLGETEFQKQFQGLTVNGGRLMAVQDKSHWSMGYGTYVNGLRDVLLAYNPGFGTVRATALSEFGIVVLDTAKSTINKQERDTSKPGYTGTKCP